MLQRHLSHLNGRKLLIFSVSGFILSYAANIFIPKILCNLCLLPAQFYYIILYIQKVEGFVDIADHCTPWKISSDAENLVLPTLQF
jgi:hypothetical protein